MSIRSSRCISVGSQPALTRESTNSNTASILPTPIDHPLLRGNKPGKSLIAPTDDVMVRVASQDKMHMPPSRVGSTGSSEPEANEMIPVVDSYFQTDSRSPRTPSRNGSTKDLINRFEAMSPVALTMSGRTSSATSSYLDPPLTETPEGRPLSALKSKSRSPLRDSFRNLMSLFGKKGKSRDDTSSFLSSRYDSAILSPSATTNFATIPSQRDNSSADSVQLPLRSGPVLYLTRLNSDSTLPVWTSCKASLLPDHILLEWLTAYGNPSSSTIMLGKSTDVHSVSKSQVDPMENSLLPLTGKDAHIFELTYPGGQPEKFATDSVAERSAWVSSIWDVLLALEKVSEIPPPTVNQTVSEAISYFATSVEKALPSNPPTPPRLNATFSSVRLPQEYLETENVALPGMASESKDEYVRKWSSGQQPLDRYSPPIDTSIETAEIPTSSTKIAQQKSRSDLFSSKFSSPSIQNLGNLSLVQDRLSKLAAGNSNVNISRTPTQLSRRISVESRYSDSPSRTHTYLATPQSLRKAPSRSSSRKMVASPSKVTVASNFEDEQSIYDYYAQQKPFSGNALSPVPDAPESQVSDSHSTKITRFSKKLEEQLPSQTANIDYSCQFNVAPKQMNFPVPNVQPPKIFRTERALPALPIAVRRPFSPTASGILTIPEPIKEDPTSKDVHPLLSLIQDHAMEQRSQTSDIGNQIVSLQQDIIEMSKDLRAVIEEQNPGTELRGVLEDLCEKMEKTAETNGAGLLELHQKIDLIASQLSEKGSTSSASSQPTPPTGTQADVEHGAKLDKIAGCFDEVQNDLRENMPVILDRLAELQKEVKPTDVSHVDAKLDELLEACRALKSSQASTNNEPTRELHNTSPNQAVEDANKEEQTDDKNQETLAAPGGEPALLQENLESKLSEILALLKGQEDNRKLGSDQQAENVRYLHELNTWLESFVNNGTTQIQTVACGIEKLLAEISPPQRDVGPSEGEGAEPAGLRSQLDALITSVKTTEERNLGLHAMLAEALQVTKSKEAESKALDMETIIGVIERQRQEQEQMLRGIASELSNDIRGERLRFVEAMKEATAINVQVHVEEFKKELGKEVMMMTCEVGRLQRERQMLEQQIADLFAFFAKQRAEMEQNQMEMARQNMLAPQALPTRPPSRARPLPVPK